MTQVLTAAEARALLGGKKPISSHATPRNRHAPTKDTKVTVAKPQSQEEDEPATLPEGPELGRWLIEGFDVRTTTTYSPKIRVVITGPASTWDALLTHLKAFKP